MAQQYILNISTNDHLVDVIRKCNRNFRSIMNTLTKQTKQQIRDNKEEIDEDITRIDGELVSISEAISNEANTRTEEDERLRDEIDTIRDSIPSVLDVYPIGSLYLSLSNSDPGTIFGGTWELIQDTFLLSTGQTSVVGDTGSVDAGAGADVSVPWLAVNVWKRTA